MKRLVLTVLFVNLLLASGCKQPAATSAPDAAAPVAALDAGATTIERPAPRGGEVKKLADGALELVGHTETILAVALDAAGKRAATGGLDRSVRLWDVETGKLLWSAGPADEAITTMMFDPSGERLAVGDRAYQVRVFAVKDGELLVRRAHPDAVATVSWSPDGSWLAVAGVSGNAEVYPAGDASPSKCELRGRTAHFTDDGKVLVTTLQTGMLVASSFPQCKKLKETSTLPQHPLGSASPSSKKVATFNGGEPVVMLWDSLGGRMLGKLDKQTEGVTTVTLSADGSRALVGSADHRVRLYDTAKPEVLRSFEVAAMPFASMTPDAAKAIIADNIVARVVSLAVK
ncbi:MAG: hypothetical protein JNK82_18245 [Myxococcaceae bacterium]|nr:hypothetical protein [Myxococcaceae bacterium]